MTIKGENWIIRENDKLDSSGLCTFKTKTIEIQGTMSDKDKRIALYHELFHALFAELSLENTSLSECVEEIVVDQIAIFIDKTFNIPWR